MGSGQSLVSLSKVFCRQKRPVCRVVVGGVGEAHLSLSIPRAAALPGVLAAVPRCRARQGSHGGTVTECQGVPVGLQLWLPSGICTLAAIVADLSVGQRSGRRREALWDALGAAVLSPPNGPTLVASWLWAELVLTAGGLGPRCVLLLGLRLRPLAPCPPASAGQPTVRSRVPLYLGLPSILSPFPCILLEVSPQVCQGVATRRWA